MINWPTPTGGTLPDPFSLLRADSTLKRFPERFALSASPFRGPNLLPAYPARRSCFSLGPVLLVSFCVYLVHRSMPQARPCSPGAADLRAMQTLSTVSESACGVGHVSNRIDDSRRNHVTPLLPVPRHHPNIAQGRISGCDDKCRVAARANCLCLLCAGACRLP